VEDAVAGVLDDDGDELVGMARADLHAVVVDNDLAVGVAAAAGWLRRGRRPTGRRWRA
jgi:hypothetical protein